jgi:hypothetical protein
MKLVTTLPAALALCLAASGAPAQDSRVAVVFHLRHEKALLRGGLRQELRTRTGS